MNHGLTLGVFGVLVLAMLAVIIRAGRRTRTAGDFWAAGRGIGSPQNGLAVAGDFMSAGTFLGTVGLIFLTGFDGTLILLAALFSFLPVLFLLAERLRNSGAFTLADVLSLRFRGEAVRGSAAVNTLVVSFFYLFAQLVGAGTLLQALSGLSFTTAVLITGAFMTVYVTLGGMLGATWVMIVKALLLVVAALVMSGAVLAHAGWDFNGLLHTAAARQPAGDAIRGPGLLLPHHHALDKVDIISYGLVYMLGTAGLPHVLVRFFTVRDGHTARRSLGWAIGVMGVFFGLIVIIGFGARALLDAAAAKEATGAGGNLVAPILARELAGGAGSAWGDISLAVISGVAFLTILAVVSGLLLSASGAVAHDLWTGSLHHNSEKAARQEPAVARITAVVMGVLATLGTCAIGSGRNITFLLGLAFLIAASANLPVVVLTLFWRRFTARGAVAGLIGGLLVSIVVIALSPTWLHGDAIIKLSYPAIISIPAGFLISFLATFAGRGTPDQDAWESMSVRTQLGVRAAGKQPAPAVPH
ncbi:cation acetate symporter [Streptomyces sp. NBC_01476]|uniref:solute symporter family protein n=1 Tax=Streptomyces sp. NBC_01476 TaxID=2903881 RepID=UPI002E30C7A4|nr:cation acetate symporter [Streptomyces sp. NBC_01476]